MSINFVNEPKFFQMIPRKITARLMDALISQNKIIYYIVWPQTSGKNDLNA